MWGIFGSFKTFLLLWFVWRRWEGAWSLGPFCLFVYTQVVLDCLPAGVVVIPRPSGEYLSIGSAPFTITIPTGIGINRREGHSGKCSVTSRMVGRLGKGGT